MKFSNPRYMFPTIWASVIVPLVVLSMVRVTFICPSILGIGSIIVVGIGNSFIISESIVKFVVILI